MVVVVVRAMVVVVREEEPDGAPVVDDSEVDTGAAVVLSAGDGVDGLDGSAPTVVIGASLDAAIEEPESASLHAERASITPLTMTITALPSPCRVLTAAVPPRPIHHHLPYEIGAHRRRISMPSARRADYRVAHHRGPQERFMTLFDQTTTVNFGTDGARQVEVDLPEAWSSLMGAHGGFVTALAVRAVEARLVGQGVRTVATTFLRPVAIGDATLTVTALRTGRSLSTFEVALHQSDRQATSTRITAAVAATGSEWDHAPVLDVPPVEDCVVVPGPPGIHHLDHGTGVLDPAHLPLTRSGEAILRGHIRPAEPRPIDEAWLVMVLDYFPPAAWTKVDPPAGGVSVDYTVHIHRTLDDVLPADQWLAVSLRADVSTAGLSLEHGAIAAPDGRLLAESFHTRWTG